MLSPVEGPTPAGTQRQPLKTEFQLPKTQPKTHQALQGETQITETKKNSPKLQIPIKKVVVDSDEEILSLYNHSVDEGKSQLPTFRVSTKPAPL